jgi:hypothetical protein
MSNINKKTPYTRADFEAQKKFLYVDVATKKQWLLEPAKITDGLPTGDLYAIYDCSTPDMTFIDQHPMCDVVLITDESVTLQVQGLLEHKQTITILFSDCNHVN